MKLPATAAWASAVPCKEPRRDRISTFGRAPSAKLGPLHVKRWFASLLLHLLESPTMSCAAATRIRHAAFSPYYAVSRDTREPAKRPQRQSTSRCVPMGTKFRVKPRAGPRRSRKPARVYVLLRIAEVYIGQGDKRCTRHG